MMKKWRKNNSAPSHGAPDLPLASTCFMAAATGVFRQLRQVWGFPMGRSVHPPPLAHPRRPDLLAQRLGGTDHFLSGPVQLCPARPGLAVLERLLFPGVQTTAQVST